LKLKILAFSDLHDDEEALLKISKIAPNYDLVLGCGDLCETNSFYDDLSEKFSSLKNFYFIFWHGNIGIFGLFGSGGYFD
jgi:Icc-related predicted phosphoesterase